jgi:hypothetical protein
MDQEKEANPIAEIFDEVFTLMEDLETRSGAILEYMKEQGGVSDEKLAPYLDRAAAASDVRWRAARARMEHLLAPKPKSSTDVGKKEKAKDASQSQAQPKKDDAKSSETTKQGEKQGEKQGTRAEPKDLGKELVSAQPGPQDSTESKDGKTQNAKPDRNTKSDQNKAEDGQQEANATAKDAESQAAALGEKNSNTPNGETAKSQTPQSASENSTSRSSGEENQQTQKAAE